LIPGAGKREIIVKASEENLREEDSRCYWRRQAVLDCTWKLPNVEKMKEANQLTTGRTQQ